MTGPAGSAAEHEPDAEQLVTVAIPARNEEAWIVRSLQSVLDQDHTNLQVIVVDGASTDQTPAIVRSIAERDGRVQLITIGTASIPASLNAALAATRSAWFVRVDAHSTIPRDYVGIALRHLSGGEWAGVGGRKDGIGDTTTGSAIAAALGSPFGVGNSTYHHGTEQAVVDHIPFGAYRTDVLHALEGWDERLTANEDFELDYRLRHSGHRLLFDPALRIEWGSRQRLGELFSQYRRYGRGKADVALLHPDSIAPRHLAAPALVAAFAGAAALAGRRPRLVGALAALYGSALAAATVREMRAGRPPKVLARLPLAFASMHVGWGIGFWEGLARGLRPWRRRPGGAASRPRTADPVSGPAHAVDGPSVADPRIGARGLDREVPVAVRPVDPDARDAELVERLA